MAILSNIYKAWLRKKTDTGYITIKPKTDADCVNFTKGDGTTTDLQTEVTAINSKIYDDYIDESYSNAVCNSNGDLKGTKITITETGLYLITLCAVNGSTSTDGFTELGLGKSPDIIVPFQHFRNNGMSPMLYGTRLIPLKKGDVIFHRVFQNGGWQETISARQLTMVRVR